MHLDPRGLRPGKLPPSKTAEDVLGDFLRYMFRQTVAFIKTFHINDLWDQVKGRPIFVLGHPNGWDGLPQQRMRHSAVLGGLIPDTPEGRSRVKFVTEGEASALTCLASGLGPMELKVRLSA